MTACRRPLFKHDYMKYILAIAVTITHWLNHLGLPWNWMRGDTFETFAAQVSKHSPEVGTQWKQTNYHISSKLARHVHIRSKTVCVHNIEGCCKHWMSFHVDGNCIDERSWSCLVTRDSTRRLKGSFLDASKAFDRVIIIGWCSKK